MDINLVILIILVFLAIMDLTVGVANDAINFLNSAIGSNAAKFKTILLIAALGILVGVLVSDGMMEVARKGIFNPEHFVMPELMIIFVSVMFLDIILIDAFNTFGLPTSTTVSIVFGLFGSGLAMSIVKIGKTTGDYSELIQYMNVGMVMTIVGAILLSILFAFVFGIFVQYITRLFFSFDFEKRFKRYGAFWGSFALTSITLFVLMKGIKHTEIMQGDMKVYLQSNLGAMFLYLYVIWAVILFVLQRFTRVNILKLIVLVGTFSLAMAFAANDLVNFIGAPLAAFNAYTIASLSANPLTADMAKMQGHMPVNMLLLLFSGGVMILALFFSKKAKTVSATEINLGRQEEGYERFESSALARAIVRMVYSFFSEVKKYIPDSVIRFVNKRLDPSKFQPEISADGHIPSFDLLRAAVILFVSAALISLGTYYKLPLSTTYVTFIVAMAAALPDKAWGRDSAVYRVSGVLTVVGGWFVTGLFAAIGAMIICFIIYYGSWFGLSFILLITAFTIYRSGKFHKAKEEKHRLAEEKLKKEEATEAFASKKVMSDISIYLEAVADTFIKSNFGLINEDLKGLKKAKKKAVELEKEVIVINSNIIRLINKLEYEETEFANLSIRMTTFLQDISDKLFHSASQNYKYVNNNHKSLTEDEKALLERLDLHFSEYSSMVIESISTNSYNNYEQVKDKYSSVFSNTNELYKNQLRRIKKQKSTVRRSIIMLNLISDFEIQAELSFKVYETAKITNSQI